MPIAVTAAQALANRRSQTITMVTDRAPFHRRLYIGSEPTLGGIVEADKLTLPQAYLVEQPANCVVPAHFHDTNQFQIFVHGGGEFGKKPVSGIVVHYAGAHTPYGPIASGDDGAHYMTLRNKWDSGAKPMPESRAKLRPIRRVHRIAEDAGIPDAAALKAATASATDLVPPEADGLGVRRFDLGPGRRATIDFETPGAGQYAFVASGTVRLGDRDLARHALIYRAPDETALDVVAGPDGASVLLLQFPPEPPAEGGADPWHVSAAR